MLEYIAIDKANGVQLVPTKQIRGSVGAEREAWRLATQAEVDSLRGNGSYAEATPAQLSALLTAGFLLFLMTLVVNSIAAVVVSRSRGGAVTEL